MRRLGESTQGLACCGEYKYYAFPELPENQAPVAFLNLSSGAIKALYWKYASCPVENEDVRGEVCVDGWLMRTRYTLSWYASAVERLLWRRDVRRDPRDLTRDWRGK